MAVRRIAGALAPLVVVLACAAVAPGANHRGAGEAEVAAAGERLRELIARGRWSDGELGELVGALLVDPARFATDAVFRSSVLPGLAAALPAGTPAALRDDLLARLNRAAGFDFAAADAVEPAWRAVPRAAGSREVPPGATAPRIEDDPARPLLASFLSLPSRWIAPVEARALVAALHHLAPERSLLVLADPAQAAALAGAAPPGVLRLLPTYGRDYSPWPRDPLAFARDATGAVRIVMRPNLQPGREEDAALGLELVQNLPADLDAAWGSVRWVRVAVPFHNGQVLLTRDAAWVSLHTLELGALTALGAERVPVEQFGTTAGIDRYLAAARAAAGDLERLYGRPVRFVHPLPAVGPAPERSALMRRLGGGAGYDLDSLLTLLPRAGEPPAALVADPRAGEALLAAAPDADLVALAGTFGVDRRAGDLRLGLRAALRGPDTVALADYLDLVAGHLAALGLPVRRLPLLVAPVPLLGGDELGHASFLLGWNNVVVEGRGGALRAEGFASGLPSGDRLAREAFAAYGVQLDLLPPLVGSVVRNGGYRCASNHLRGEE